MRQLAQQNTHRVVEDNQKLRLDIQRMMDELEARNKQMEDLAAQTEEDKRSLELEREKVETSFLCSMHCYQHYASLEISICCVVSFFYIQ